MKIEKTLHDSWRLLHEHGDISEIAIKNGMHRVTISTAINTGKMSESTFEAIQKFYTAKKQRQMELLKKANPDA